MFVKIVHPGGHVELHDRPILAAELLDRNPKCCVAHPTIFQQPHAIVSPETTLLLGRKYYVVPLGTIRKLQLKHRRGPRARGVGGDVAAVDLKPTIARKSRSDRDAGCPSSSSSCWLFRNGKSGEERDGRGEEDDGELGARIGVGSSGSSGDDETARMVRTESGGGGGGRRVGREFDGNGVSSSSSSPGRISLQSVDNWQPGLNSICEEY